MPVQAIFAIVFIGLSLVYMVWMKGKAKQGLANARPAFQSFFERTGYRYADIAEQGVEAQVERAYHDAAHPDPSGNVNLHYVRAFHGVRRRVSCSGSRVTRHPRARAGVPARRVHRGPAHDLRAACPPSVAGAGCAARSRSARPGPSPSGAATRST